MLNSIPSRHCIRPGAQPGCIWRDGAGPAGPLSRGPPRPARSPEPAAGWRGQTKTPAPRASRDLNRAFMAFRRAEASSADWPPDRNAIPGTAAGTARKRHLTVASATSSTVACWGQVNPGKHHVGFQDHALQHHPLHVKLVENRVAGLPPLPRRTAPGYGRRP